jgi:ribosomal protein S18 acetylase RimI-like enzyme
MPQIEFKLLKSGDATSLGRVAEEVFDAPIDAIRLSAYLLQPGHHMIVAMHEDIVVGQTAAVVHRHPDKPTELYIDEVGVAVGYRRQGIARRMLELMLVYGKAIGCEEAWVGTEPDNLPARSLYERQRQSGDAGAEPFVMYVYRL